jgi:hypothetical protein
MPWDRNDWIASALIMILIIVGFLVAAMLLGWMPRVDQFFEFTGEPEHSLSIVLRIAHMEN